MKSRFFRCLPLALLIFSMALTGCATTGSPEATAPTKHIHSPWRYKHMSHVHTRPWGKDQALSPKPCVLCANDSKAAPAPPTAKPKPQPEVAK